MEIKVITIEQKEAVLEMPVTTVVVDRSDDDMKVNMFHCCNCGKPLMQYRGRIAFILPGAAPCNMPIIVQCDRCKTKYMVRANL